MIPALKLSSLTRLVTLSVAVICTLPTLRALGPADRYVMSSADTAGRVCRIVHHADSATIRFYQGQSRLALDLDNNAAALDSLSRTIGAVQADPTRYRLTGVRVVGSASPEGSVAINDRLSRQRANRIFDYVNRSTPLADSLTTFEFTGRDWHRLLTMVADDTALPYRNQTVALLSDIVTDPATVPHPLQRLQTLGSGESYSYLYTRYFPQLRRSTLVVEYASMTPDYGWNLQELTQARAFQPMPEPAVLPAEVTHKPFYMAVKTNMLYDAAAVPNIGLEFYLGKNWSVYGNWMYAWWSNDARHRYWRIYGGDLTVRYWFGRVAHRKPLTGHHLGVYGGIVTYDFELGGRGYMGGIPGGTLWDRCMHVAGIEYGYSLPVAKRLNIDFTIAVGYMGGKTVKYHPDTKFYIWDMTKRTHWFGPTRAEVSLVWLIGRGNVNNRKGGR